VNGKHPQLAGRNRERHEPEADPATVMVPSGNQLTTRRRNDRPKRFAASRGIVRPAGVMVRMIPGIPWGPRRWYCRRSESLARACNEAKVHGAALRLRHSALAVTILPARETRLSSWPPVLGFTESDQQARPRFRGLPIGLPAYPQSVSAEGGLVSGRGVASGRARPRERS